MTLRQSISLVLIASQVGMGTLAFADTTAPQASITTPEFTLVENVLALQGQDFSSTTLQNRVNSLTSAYLATASASGSQQRFQQALVDLGVYTTQQAASFAADAQSASMRILSAKPVATAQTQTLISQEMTQLAAMHPAGAQFSADIAVCTGEVTATAGALVVLTGLILRFDNPTCSAPTYSASTCGPDGCYNSTITGPTTCTQADYYPHAQIGNDVMIGGGVVLGIGALLYYIGSRNAGDDC